MEPKLGADLSDVRVHVGGESAQAAAGFGARAFTQGSDVHFGAGEFDPGTKKGDNLIAHELTHVVQGQKSGIQRKADEGAEDHAADAGGDHDHEAEVSQPEDAAEKEADHVAEKVTDSLHGDDAKEPGGEGKEEKGKAGTKGAGKPGAKGDGNKPADGKSAGGKDAKGGKDEKGDGKPGAKAEAKGEAAKEEAAKEHGGGDASGKAAGGEQSAAGDKKAESPSEKPSAVSRKVASISAPLKLPPLLKKRIVHRLPTPGATPGTGNPKPANPTANGASGAPPAGNTQQAPVKPKVVFDSITLSPAMTGGNEKVQVRPTTPGQDGKAELWVANQKGSKRLEDIANGPLATAKNRAGVGVVEQAMVRISDLATQVEAIAVEKGKVDEDKMPTLRAKGDEASGVISALGQKLRINSLEGANHKRAITNKQRVVFEKPNPAEWKTPYISKFIGEMVKQLQQQETGINQLSLDEWVINREKFCPTEHLNEIHESAKQEVLKKMKERCDEGLPRAQARLTKVQAKKVKLEAALQALQTTAAATPDQMKEAMKKAKDAASDVRETAAEIQGYIDAIPEVATGQAGGKVKPDQMKGAGGRENGQAAWAAKHKKAKEALVKLIEKNDPLVAEWVGIVKETGDLAVLHDPDQIAGGNGDILPLPVVKEPTDPNDTDGHELWRKYLTDVKAHLGVKDINGSLGSQWKTRISTLYTAVTQDPDNPQEAYGIRSMSVQFVPG